LNKLLNITQIYGTAKMCYTEQQAINDDEQG